MGPRLLQTGKFDLVPEGCSRCYIVHKLGKVILTLRSIEGKIIAKVFG